MRAAGNCRPFLEGKKVTDNQLPDFDTVSHIFAILMFAAAAAFATKLWIGD